MYCSICFLYIFIYIIYYQGLVDYDGDSDEEEDDDISNVCTPVAKRARLT